MFRFKTAKCGIVESKSKILVLSYLTAFFSGYAFPVAGILSPQIATDLGVKTSLIVFVDAFFLVGITFGSVISGKILCKMGAVRSIVIAVSALAFLNFFLAIQFNLYVYGFLVLMNGTCTGLLIASVNYFILSGFFSNDNSSESKLNIMQFFVGIGGFVGTLSTGFIVYYFSWRMVFVTIVFFYVLILLAFKFIRVLPVYQVDRDSEKNVGVQRMRKLNFIPLYLLMVGFALISYVYAEYIVSYWFSPYLQEVKLYNVKSVGKLISVFWLTLAFGRLLLGKYILAKVSDYAFVIALSIITLFGFFCFVFSQSMVTIYLSIFLLGFGCSAIFPTLLAYGMKLSERLSAYNLSFLVTCGFFGGILSLICSSVIGAKLPKIVPILTGPVWCMLIVVFLFLAKKLKKVEASNSN
jgi:MFS transporter, TsgA protein